MLYTVSAISAAQARPLRQRVLRPHQTLESLRYPGDDDAESAHFGAFCGGELVGVVTLLRNPKPGTNDSAWQLRGMATVAEHRGLGVGRMLLETCFGHIRQCRKDGIPHSVLWCNARQSAMEFYRKGGFTPEGDFFDYQGVGPHVVMVRGVS